MSATISLVAWLPPLLAANLQASVAARFAFTTGLSANW
uniref:Uncharacterized protein n=1 Tax=Rhizophora mucronata TaxID=61149 RepID=A0A2P2JPU2_RHIMU